VRIHLPAPIHVDLFFKCTRLRARMERVVDSMRARERENVRDLLEPDSDGDAGRHERARQRTPPSVIPRDTLSGPGGGEAQGEERTRTQKLRAALLASDSDTDDGGARTRRWAMIPAVDSSSESPSPHRRATAQRLGAETASGEIDGEQDSLASNAAGRGVPRRHDKELILWFVCVCRVLVSTTHARIRMEHGLLG
jgi:hypothetical protein